jgi:hypothetical protein
MREVQGICRVVYWKFFNVRVELYIRRFIGENLINGSAVYADTERQ